MVHWFSFKVQLSFHRTEVRTVLDNAGEKLFHRSSPLFFFLMLLMYLVSFFFYTGPLLRFLAVDVSQWLFLVSIYISEQGFISLSFLQVISLGIFFSFQNDNHMLPQPYLYSFANEHCCYFYSLLFCILCISFISTRLGDVKRFKKNPTCFEQLDYDVSWYNSFLFLIPGIYTTYWICGFKFYSRFGKEN